MPEPIFSTAGAKALLSSTFAAGLVGAVLSLRFATNLSPWGRATAVIGGTVIAQLTTPLVAHVLALHDYQQSIGFLLGLFGLSFVAAAYETIRKADIWALISTRYGNK